MMGRIPDEVRGGFLELFYAVFEKNSDNAVKALSKMGVLVETGGDLTAVKRTADFFLGSFDERVDKQEKARETNKDEYESEFKKQRTKEEKKARRGQILSNIEDLLVVSKDQPFGSPPGSRSWSAPSVLNGIGKSLNKKFDIGEILGALRALAAHRGQPVRRCRAVVGGRQPNFQRRFIEQNKAIINLFKGPDAIDDIAEVGQRDRAGEAQDSRPRARSRARHRARRGDAGRDTQGDDASCLARSTSAW